MYKKVSAVIISVLTIFTLFAFPSFAANESNGSYCDCVNLTEAFVKEKYGLDNGDWGCTEEDGKYAIVVQVPLERTCDIITTREGAFVWSDVSKTTCRETVASGDVEIGKITEKEPETECQTDNNGVTSCNTKQTITSYVAGYTTIYSDKQLQMGDVDINIVDGMVKITGIANDDTTAWNIIYEKYKVVIIGVTGLCILTCSLVFVVSAMKLGATAGNPTERKKVMTSMLLSGIGTAGLGAAVILFSFFYNLL